MKRLKIITTILFGIAIISMGWTHKEVFALSEPTPPSQITTELNELPPIELVIRAEGSVEVLPDIAEVFIQIEYSDMVKETAEISAFNIFKSTKEKLINLGIAENLIKNLNSYTYPCRDNSNNDYRSNIYFSFEVTNLDNLANILDELKDDYLTISSVNYKISDCEKHYLQALQVAISNSFSKAQTLAGSTNVALVKISEDYNYCCNYIYREYNKETIAVDVATPIEITANIQTTYLV